MAICERSPRTSVRVFARLAQEAGQLRPWEFALLKSLQAFLPVFTGPVHHIYVRCSPETALERIHRRGRLAEQSVSLEFLQQVERAHEQLYAGYLKARTPSWFKNSTA